MQKKTTLVVMAAGMGSRFGGLKQIEPVGPNGEVILDFSVYDAVKAGFSKVIFIIRKDIEKDFRNITKKRIEKMADVEYIYQDGNNLPNGFYLPEGRTKPWGTGHAAYCVRNAVNTPFTLINADDYYGQSAYKLIHENLVNYDETCMVGYHLGNTLTENGTVSRGVCKTENGFLKSITEHTSLDKNSGISLDTPVSMNFWGFMPAIFEDIEKDFIEFLSNLKNPLKDEFYIPFVVDNMIKNKGAKVKVLETDEKWYGVTYREDLDDVVSAMHKKIAGGFYDGI